MGLVYAEIELINGGDLEMARRSIIGEEEVKRTKIYRNNFNCQLLKKEKHKWQMAKLFNVM
jgi:hypothetical protein